MCLTARYKAVHCSYNWNRYLNPIPAVPAPPVVVAAERGLDRHDRHVARPRDELQRTTSHSHVTARTCHYITISRRRRRTIIDDTTTISRRTTLQRTTTRVWATVGTTTTDWPPTPCRMTIHSTMTLAAISLHHRGHWGQPSTVWWPWPLYHDITEVTGSVHHRGHWVSCSLHDDLDHYISTPQRSSGSAIHCTMTLTATSAHHRGHRGQLSTVRWPWPLYQYITEVIGVTERRMRSAQFRDSARTHRRHHHGYRVKLAVE